MPVGAHTPLRGRTLTRTMQPARFPVHAAGPGQIPLGGRSSPAVRAIHAISEHAPHVRSTRASYGFPTGVYGLWRRFSDDRDLFRVKIILLAGLVALAAALEWVV